MQWHYVLNSLKRCAVVLLMLVWLGVLIGYCLLNTVFSHDVNSKQYTVVRQPIDLEYVYNAADVCQGLPKHTNLLLIMVLTLPDHMEARQAIRDTWASEKVYKDISTKTVFFMAYKTHENVNKVDIADELRMHNDLVVYNMQEDYHNQTEKLISMMKWSNRHCSNAKYILKTDEDCFNNIPQLVDEVIKKNEDKKDYIVGRCDISTDVKRYAWKKHYVSPAVFPDPTYPQFCTGVAYLMTQSSVRRILSVIDKVNYLWIEDVFVTGICREAAGIKDIMHHKGIGVKSRDGLTCDHAAPPVLNIHGVTPQQLKEVWHFFNHKSDICYSYLFRVRVVCLLLVIFTLSMILIGHIKR